MLTVIIVRVQALGTLRMAGKNRRKVEEEKMLIKTHIFANPFKNLMCSFLKQLFKKFSTNNSIIKSHCCNFSVVFI